ncbi:uncharacterized protein BX664DRAFT_327591 [Halteromyces radiatus]|uniref:uncharacterized protein n=1 Tax=Halteromyces radiatus TaxID=101107 RepID=UPI0022203B61|nr:uncharacterized protein BX664DRAFT_327591 [Halteromyces radiatus]KAI8092560.1 hypothetical protein BX664DRAFT_327591 [Halteromyces radiatus]
MFRQICLQVRHNNTIRRRLPFRIYSKPTIIGMKPTSMAQCSRQLTTRTTRIPQLVQSSDTVTDVLEQVNTEINNSIGHELLEIYASEGRWHDAQEVYDKVFRYSNDNESDIRTNMITYGLLMEAYIRGGQEDDAMEIYYSLKDHIELHPTTAQQKGLELDARFYTRLITALTTNSRIDEQKEETISRDFGYTVDDGAQEIMNVEKDSSGGLRLAMILFQDMRQQGMNVDSACYLALLQRCGLEQDRYLLQQVHQYLRMDDTIELDDSMVYALMSAYRQLGDEDAMVFEIWESMGNKKNMQEDMITLILNMCREKKYKLHAVRVWNQLSSMQKSKSSYPLMVSCLCEAGEWNHAKEIVLSQQHQDHHTYNELVELLIHYGKEQGLSSDHWLDLM